MMKEKVFAIICILYGFINISLSVLAGSIIFHLAALAITFFIIGVGLWMRKSWSINVSLIVWLISLTVGLLSIYSSIRLFGLNVNFQIILLNLFLAGYSIGSFALFVYTLVNKSRMLSSTSN